MQMTQQEVADPLMVKMVALPGSELGRRLNREMPVVQQKAICEHEFHAKLNAAIFETTKQKFHGNSISCQGFEDSRGMQ